MHVDYNVDPLTGNNKPTLYTVESSRINQLRGDVSTLEYSGMEFIQIMQYCGEEAADGSLLDLLYRQHLNNRSQRRTFLSFLQFILRDCNNGSYLDIVNTMDTNSPIYVGDLFTIKKTVTAHRFTIKR
jgi:hypothetical protein